MHIIIKEIRISRLLLCGYIEATTCRQKAMNAKNSNWEILLISRCVSDRLSREQNVASVSSGDVSE